MHTEAAELAPVHDLGRQALKEVLEGHMRQRIEHYLGDVRRMGGSDRWNGHYRRWLLTGMGAIELHVPRTRTFSAVGALAAYARREQSVDRLILAAFLLDFIPLIILVFPYLFFDTLRAAALTSHVMALIMFVIIGYYYSKYANLNKWKGAFVCGLLGLILVIFAESTNLVLI
jgi:VIT1/CCC1 family predicted Fe2+/Mn2+ transporter